MKTYLSIKVLNADNIDDAAKIVGSDRIIELTTDLPIIALENIGTILHRLRTCCEEAISGDWDATNNDEGFDAMIEDIESVAELLNITL